MMNKKMILAYDLFNNLVKSEDLYENRTSIGLNKRVQKKYIEKNAEDAANSIGELDPKEFADILIEKVKRIKGVKVDHVYYDFDNMIQFDVTLHSSSDSIVGVYFLIPTEREKNEPYLVGYFGMCLYDDMNGSTKRGYLDEWDVDFNDKDSVIDPIEKSKYTMYAGCGDMYKTNTFYLDAAIRRIKYWKGKADHHDFSPWKPVYY